MNIQAVIEKTVPVAVIAMVFLVLGIVAHTDVKEYLKIKAVDDCSKISRYEKSIKEEDATIAYPVADAYKACLQDKGY